MADPYNLERFVDAQDSGGVFNRAVTELQDGHKVSHWIWFVFPQIAGLGRQRDLEGVRHLVGWKRHRPI